MTPAIIGLISAVVALTLGKIWDRLEERRRWDRDERQSSYLAFIAAYQSIRQAVRLVFKTPSADGAYPAARANKTAAWERYNTALLNLDLHCTPEVHDSARVLDRVLNRVNKAAGDERATFDGWRSSDRELDTAMASFIETCRADLGLKRITSGFDDRDDAADN